MKALTNNASVVQCVHVIIKLLKKIIQKDGKSIVYSYLPVIDADDGLTSECDQRSDSVEFLSPSSTA